MNPGLGEIQIMNLEQVREQSGIQGFITLPAPHAATSPPITRTPLSRPFQALPQRLALAERLLYP